MIRPEILKVPLLTVAARETIINHILQQILYQIGLLETEEA